MCDDDSQVPMHILAQMMLCTLQQTVWSLVTLHQQGVIARTTTAERPERHLRQWMMRRNSGAETSFSIGASVPVRRGKKGPAPNPPAPPPSMAPPSKAEAEPGQATTGGTADPQLSNDAVQQSAIAFA